MRLKAKEIAIFGMFGALMYISKLVMEFAPNVHLLGVFTIAITVVYRVKALYPIYVYVLLNGLFAGFDLWWMPYMYIWTILWGLTMLVPTALPNKVKIVIYSLLCGIHGFGFGILYAPAQALMFGFDFDTTIKWIIAGLPFDMIHGFSNLVCSILIMPIATILKKFKD